ncbi:MAG: PTS glucose transporter subunit IIA [Erysipelotrichales bacterium]|nr:PTS glucose transporter subunit IIA [Erysipelotrichales bacterium]
MGLFDSLFNKKEISLNVHNSDIVAITDGEMIDISSVNDELFSQKVMGDGVAFKLSGDKATLYSPVNGTLNVLFPTGHAFGITMHDGVEVLVHCGINTVESNGTGFTILKKKQGDSIKAGEAIVEVDVKLLSEKYDMSTMLIITNPNGKTIQFKEFGSFKVGESIIK